MKHPVGLVEARGWILCCGRGEVHWFLHSFQFSVRNFGQSRSGISPSPTLRRTTGPSHPRMEDWLIGLHLVACVTAVAGRLTVVGLRGREVTLPCVHGAGRRDGASELVSWQRDMVVVHAQNSNGLQQQDKAYRNRTRIDSHGFRQGNYSLTLSALQVADTGTYQCIVLRDISTKVHHTEVQVKVAADFSTPVILTPEQGTIRLGDEVNLTCLSSGGYPKPQVNWTDGEGRSLPPDAGELWQDPGSGLWNASSVLRVKAERNSSYTCSILNPGTGESRKSDPWTGRGHGVPQGHSRRKPLSSVTVVCFALAFLIILGLLYHIHRRQRQRGTSSGEQRMSPSSGSLILVEQAPC